MSCRRRNHVLSLSIERINLTAKSGLLLVQHEVQTLHKLRYDVRLDSGMKRFDQIQVAPNVRGVINGTGAYAISSHKEYQLATLIVAGHPSRSKQIRYIEPHLHMSNHLVNQHH